jgi:hypothetical protein
MTELRLVLTALALAAAMLLAGVVGRRQRIGSVILALLALVWLAADHGFEGAVLLTVTHTHGLTLTDLIGLAGLGVAIWLWFRLRRTGRQASGRGRRRKTNPSGDGLGRHRATGCTERRIALIAGASTRGLTRESR